MSSAHSNEKSLTIPALSATTRPTRRFQGQTRSPEKGMVNPKSPVRHGEVVKHLVEGFKVHLHAPLTLKRDIYLYRQEEMETLSPAPFVNPVLQCALAGDVQTLQLLFEDPEDAGNERANQLLLEQDVLGRSPIFPACILGRSDVVKELVKHGANVNEQTARGYLPIHCAAAWGQLEVLTTLVELGTDILALNFRGEKACEIAARYNKTECVQFLNWAEAKLALKTYISLIQQTIADPEIVQGRLLKAEKDQSPGKQLNPEMSRQQVAP
ncbi:ankyrin repeat domain-containing protein 45 isoform X2 [Ascaphus truei]|uniref:ankyrin repeat domain-containing protein 45 isoform X2 n=1 Tax=Ascaphus truei TaxID=8439 RepID=UPI003F5ADB55